MLSYLLDPVDLEHLPGAPFDPSEVEEAVAALRGALGWHIAPEREETITLDVTHCDPVLRLPSRCVVTVDEIRNADTDEVIDPARYRVSRALSRVRCKSSYWPAGFESVEVDLTHGFAGCPTELRPIIAQMITGARERGEAITQESLGSWAVTRGQAGGPSESQMDTLARLSVRNSWPARL